MLRRLVSRILVHALATTAALVISACGGSSSAPDDDGPTVASISITGTPTSQLVPGETAPLQGTARDNSGAAVSGVTVQWTSSNQSIATVDGAGLVTAVGEGTVSITASAAQKTASVDIEIVAGGIVGPEGRTLTFLSGKATLTVPAAAVAQPVRLVLAPAIVPPNTVVMQGTAFSISPASVVFARSTVVGLSYDPARIPPAIAESGLTLYQATPIGWVPRQGTVHTATKLITTSIPGGGTYAVIVAPVTGVDIAEEFRNRAIAVGQSVTFVARAGDSFGILPGRTFQWSSSNAGRATVDATGRVTGVSPGEASITATCDGFSYSVTVTVVPRPVAEWSGAADWATNNGNASANGYVPVTVDPVAIRRLWEVETGAPNPGLPLGDVASIVTGGGRVFVNTYTMRSFTQSEPYLAAFDGQSGAKLWTRTRDASGLAYAQGSVFLMGEDSLWALNAADGTTRFRVSLGVPAPTIPSLDAPFVSDNAVFVARGGIHRFDLTTGARVFHTPGSGSPAAIAEPGTIYFDPGNGAGLTAISAATGAVTFGTNLVGCNDPFAYAVALGSSNTAVTMCGGLQAVDLQTRTKTWSATSSSGYTGAPAIANGVVYAADLGIIVDSPSFDARSEVDGSLLWSFKPREGTVTRLHGRFIVTKNVLIFSGRPNYSIQTDFVWILDLASKKVIYRIDGSGNIALSREGVLYVATLTRKLIAYSLK